MTPPGRVLMTADAVGGVWTYALELTRALGSAGVEVMLAVMGPPPSAAQQREAAELGNLHLTCGDFKLEWMGAPWEDVRRADDWLLELDARWTPEVVHLNGYCHGTLPWRAPVLMAGHSCVLSWWRAVYGEAAPADWDRYREEVAKGLAAADLVVAPSRAMLAALAEHYGVSERAARAIVIPNGRATDRFRPKAKEPVIVTAGRLWDGAKNIAAVEAVAPRLEWPVYAAGPASLDGAPAPLAQESGMLRGLGPLTPDTLADWFGRAAIFVLPARYEPFGLSVLEAALAGCALVLGDIPSLREVWDEAAVFVPPADEPALEAALHGLITSRERRLRLAAAAQARALQFSPERMARSYLAAYASLVERQPRREAVLPQAPSGA